MMGILPIGTFVGFIVEIEFKKGNKIRGLLSRYKNKYAIMDINCYKTIIFKVNDIRKSITIVEDIKHLLNKEIEVVK